MGEGLISSKNVLALDSLKFECKSSFLKKSDLRSIYLVICSIPEWIFYRSGVKRIRLVGEGE